MKRLSVAAIAALATLATADARIRYFSDQDPKIAPAGGEVVNDEGLAWRFTVPEAWSWLPLTSGDDDAKLIVYNAEMGDKNAIFGVPLDPGDGICALAHASDEETASASQDDLNKGGEAELAKLIDGVKPTGTPLDALAEHHTIEKGGKTLALLRAPVGANEKVGVIAWSALMRTPGQRYQLSCYLMIAMATPDVTATPAFTDITALIESFEPL